MKQLLTVVLVLVPLAFGCKSEETSGRQSGAEQPNPTSAPSEPIAPKLPPPGAFVLIAADAPVRIAANDDAMQIPIDPSGVGRTAKVIGGSEGFIEVETIDPSIDQPCANALGFESRVRLSFYVRPEALRPVLKSTKALAFEDPLTSPR